MRKIGVGSWVYGALSLDEIARRAHESGFDGVELLADPQEQDPSFVSGVLESYGLQVFSLTPDNVDLANPDPRIRQHALQHYLGLLEFAARLDHPLVTCHGYVGRVRATESQRAEEGLLRDSVHQIAQRASELGLRVVLEVLNRYESHLLNNAAAARQFVDDLDESSVGILLDTYHMNIEEKQLDDALRTAGDRLWLLHLADSNRQAIGRGHIDFCGLLNTLDEIHYHGPLILEVAAPGPDPFVAIKDEGSLDWVTRYHHESVEWLRQWERDSK